MIPGIRRLFRVVGRERGVEGEVDDELTFHLDTRVEFLMAEGLDRETARARAVKEFGDVTAARAELSEIDHRRIRRVNRRGILEDVAQDVRLAFRSLLRRRSYTAVGVLTLALGIGAAATIFAVVDAVLLRPLPFPESDRLAMVIGVAGPERDQRFGSYPEIRDWEERARSFEALSLYDQTTFTLSGLGAAEVLQAETVSPGLLEMLGAAPHVGRFLRPEDDTPGITPPVVLSYDLWRDRFGSSREIVGTTLTLDGVQAIVVGVAESGFRGLSFDTDLWAALLPFAPGLADDRGSRFLAAIGRLSSGATVESAQREMEAVTTTLESEFPESNTERRADVVTLHEFFLDSARTLMLALLGAVGVLLLIACVNVLNLQLVRGLARDQEVAVRYSLGARRGRVFRQLLTESLVLAAIGGAAGILAAVWGTRFLVALVPAGVIPAYADIGLDARVLIVALGLVAVAGALSGTLPALRSTRRGLSGALRSADRSGSESAAPGAFGVQHALVAVEVGLALVLMLGAVVMVRSLRAQLGVDPGFDPSNATVARVLLPAARYPDGDARIAFVDRLLQNLRERPGIEKVAIGSDAPLRGGSSAAILRVPDARGDEGIRFYRHHVTPGYFAAIGVEIIRGRAFESTDIDGAPGVAIVSRAFAEKLWPGRDGIGEVIQIPGGTAEVIGITGDARYRDLTTDLMNPGEDPDVWFAYHQIPTSSFDVIVKSRSGAPDAAIIRGAVQEIDPALPLNAVAHLEDGLALQTASNRFGAVLLSLFGVAALALAAIGLFGVMSFVVSMRRREIAIRIALGSSPSGVLRRVLRQGLIVVAGGVAAGLIASIAGRDLMNGIVFGVTPLDPLSVAVVVGVLVLTAALANLIPAARAAGTEPQSVLRGD
jgi:predicted permease